MVSSGRGEMMDIECPECGHEFDICNDDGHGCDPSDTYQEKCPKCNKYFVFTVDWSPTYYELKAPCLNGGKHEWEKIHGVPEIYFENKYRCKYCEEEIEIK